MCRIEYQKMENILSLDMRTVHALETLFYEAAKKKKKKPKKKPRAKRRVRDVYPFPLPYVPSMPGEACSEYVGGGGDSYLV